MTKNKFVLLDLFRGMAAILVFIGHLRSLMFVDYDGGGILKKVFYASTSLGHEAVIIFFVLSGFFITRSILFKVAENNWHWQSYIVDRAFRILVVLIPAVIFTFVIDTIGVFYFGKEPLYLGLIGSSVIVEPVVNNLYLVNLLSNIALIPTEIINATGSNASLWSISFEFWSYVLFPLVLFCFINKYSNKMKLLFTFFALFILILIAKDGFLYFSLWCFGALAAFIKKNYVVKKNFFYNFFMSLQFLVVILFSISGKSNDYILAFSFLIFIVYNAENKIKSNFIQYISEYFSRISYTLYATHLPLVMFSLATLGLDFRLQLDASNMFYFLLITLSIILFANAFWYLFERNTVLLKNKFNTIFNMNNLLRT